MQKFTINIPVASLPPEVQKRILQWVKNDRKTITVTLEDGRVVKAKKVL